MDIFGVTLIINEKEPSVVFLWLLVRSAKKNKLKLTLTTYLLLKRSTTYQFIETFMWICLGCCNSF